MKTSLLKLSIPILSFGFLLTPQLGTQAYLTNEVSESTNEMTKKHTPYENQLTELDKELQIMKAQLNSEDTISFEQYGQYQSTLTNLIQGATAISRKIEPKTLTDQFEQLVIIQEILQGIDVN